MKKILLAGIAAAALSCAPAFAADMPVKGPVYKAAPVLSWTGCYLGANIGGGWGRERWTFPVTGGNSAGNPDPDGWLGGGQVGCDYQTGAWVIGVEGMFDWGRLKGSAHDPSGAPTTSANTKNDRVDTATARLGYAFGQALIYVDGGAAWVHNKRFFTAAGALIPPEVDNTKSGWTVGAGLEYMFAPNWSWKIDYNHFDFGTNTGLLLPGGGAPGVSAKQHIDTVLVGINFRFGSVGKSPVVAKY